MGLRVCYDADAAPVKTWGSDIPCAHPHRDHDARSAQSADTVATPPPAIPTKMTPAPASSADSPAAPRNTCLVPAKNPNLLAYVFQPPALGYTFDNMSMAAGGGRGGDMLVHLSGGLVDLMSVPADACGMVSRACTAPFFASAHALSEAEGFWGKLGAGALVFLSCFVGVVGMLFSLMELLTSPLRALGHAGNLGWAALVGSDIAAWETQEAIKQNGGYFGDLFSATQDPYVEAAFCDEVKS